MARRRKPTSPTGYRSPNIAVGIEPPPDGIDPPPDGIDLLPDGIDLLRDGIGIV
jgi:hypothetical protein